MIKKILFYTTGTFCIILFYIFVGLLTHFIDGV